MSRDIIVEIREVLEHALGNRDDAYTATQAFLQHFGGQQIYVPKQPPEERNRSILALFRKGASVHDLARRFKVAENTIYQIVRHDDSQPQLF